MIFFAWVAVMFTTPLGEGDFFWHVKTGEWIWQHKSLPVSDPFSFTVKEINPLHPESKRIPFLLKQYWLGQLVFYAIWKGAGEAGMVIFRSLCYTGILLFLYKWLKQLRTGMVPMLAVVAVGSVLRNYSNERPQIFGYLLMPVLLFLLERIRTSGQVKAPSWPAIALPLVMLLWSNCHGSFILGIVVICLYAAGHIIDCLRGREQLGRGALILFAASALITLVNPNGYGAFTEFFALSSSYTNLVVEYISPLRLAYQHHIFDYGYWILLVAALLTTAFSLRRMATAHLLVIAALIGLSLTGTRYIPFFIMIVPLLGSYLPELQPGKWLCYAPVLVVLAMLATADYGNVMKFRAERAFPVNASRFLGEVNPAGNMFNYIGWGGYLMCYTSHPVFIDGRTLVEDLLPIHNRVLGGLGWQAILDSYAINFIMIPGTDAITLQAYPLLLQLLGADQWSLVYQDEVALIFIRNSAKNSAIVTRYAIDKGKISTHIQARWQWQTVNNF
jgi:hypothetical protein